MQSGIRLNRLTRAALPALALMCAIPVAASAHGDGHFGGFGHHGFWADDAVVAGTVSSVGSSSFGANAYALTPGAGNSSGTPATTAVTIQLGSGTKVVTAGQSGIATGDDFYAIYRGVPAGTPLATLASDTPSKVFAFAAPTPQVEVRGVITGAPAGGSDSFTATAYVMAPEHFFPGGGGGDGGGHTHPGSSGAGSGKSHGGTDPSSNKGFSYSYGGKVGGSYGYSGKSGHVRSARLRGAHLRSHCLPGTTPVSDGTPGTVITTDSSTQITVGDQSSSVSNLAVGDDFTAVYDGTPDESLATVTSTPALSVQAWAPSAGKAWAPPGSSLYAFVGTISSTDTTGGTITVNVTGSIPNDLFSGTDTFDVGSQTIVLGNSGSTLFGSLGNVTAGDVVAGGLIAPSGANASIVEATPLQVLVDFPQSSSSNSSATAQQASIRRAERRALKLLRHEKAKYGHHKKK
jgi:hypothetical protein